MDWRNDVIQEYRTRDEEGTLQLNFFKHNDKVDDDGVEQVIISMTQEQRDKVRSMVLSSCNQITDAALTTIGKHIRHLTIFSLNGCVVVTDVASPPSSGTIPISQILNYLVAIRLRVLLSMPSLNIVPILHVSMPSVSV